MGDDFGGTLAIWVFGAMIASWLLLNMLLDIGEHHLRRRTSAGRADHSPSKHSQNQG